MYVGRPLEILKNQPLADWSKEELAYFRTVLSSVKGYTNDAGKSLQQKIVAEIQARGGFPEYGGEYDLPSHIIYD